MICPGRRAVGPSPAGEGCFRCHSELNSEGERGQESTPCSIPLSSAPENGKPYCSSIPQNREADCEPSISHVAVRKKTAILHKDVSIKTSQPECSPTHPSPCLACSVEGHRGHLPEGAGASNDAARPQDRSWEAFFLVAFIV